jgi:malonate-semialdehyde dehydrogenase (acetylating)/methylmalonate-semialdehyde dehydrogenase
MTTSTDPASGPPAGPGGQVEEIPHWIGGRRTGGRPVGASDVFDPATGAVTGRVALGSAEDVGAAVAAAAEAFETWQNASLSQRVNVMFAFRQLLDAERDRLARILSSEHGKVYADALGEVQRGIEVVEYACGIPSLLKGEVTPDVSSSVDAFSMRQPLGVVAGITPFNFPAMVPLWMFPVAIACGNTFVLKPSEKDPSASLLLAELFQQAGLPDGVFNVVQGDATAVNALLDHPEVVAVSFVGSTPIARAIHQRATANGKRVQALGGAKNHMVVLPDADVGQAADAAVSAGYGSAGERCMAISVVVAVGSVGDRLIPAIEERLAGLRIGPGLSDEPMDMGALVTRAHQERVRSYIDLGLGEGADLVVDGRGLSIEGHPDGFWLGPCLFDHVTADMKIYQDEIFGPVLAVVRADSYDDAIGLVNDNPYGNGTAVFTNDGGAARAFQRDVKAGMVGVNVPIPVPMAYHSFGGWKDSLFGDHHIYGPEGVRFYTSYKAVTVRWPDPHERGVDLGFPQAT